MYGHACANQFIFACGPSLAMQALGLKRPPQGNGDVAEVMLKRACLDGGANGEMDAADPGAVSLTLTDTPTPSGPSDDWGARTVEILSLLATVLDGVRGLPEIVAEYVTDVYCVVLQPNLESMKIRLMRSDTNELIYEWTVQVPECLQPCNVSQCASHPHLLQLTKSGRGHCPDVMVVNLCSGAIWRCRQAGRTWRCPHACEFEYLVTCLGAVIRATALAITACNPTHDSRAFTRIQLTPTLVTPDSSATAGVSTDFAHKHHLDGVMAGCTQDILDLQCVATRGHFLIMMSKPVSVGIHIALWAISERHSAPYLAPFTVVCRPDHYANSYPLIAPLHRRHGEVGARIWIKGGSTVSFVEVVLCEGQWRCTRSQMPHVNFGSWCVWGAIHPASDGCVAVTLRCRKNKSMCWTIVSPESATPTMWPTHFPVPRSSRDIAELLLATPSSVFYHLDEGLDDNNDDEPRMCVRQSVRTNSSFDLLTENDDAEPTVNVFAL